MIIKLIKLLIVVFLLSGFVLAFYIAKNSSGKIEDIDIVTNKGLLYESKQNIIDAILNVSDKEWFDIDIDDLNKEVLDVKGVEYSLIKKVWPSTLVIYLYEDQPLAYWNSGILLDTYKVIHPEFFNYKKFMPHILTDGKVDNKYIYGKYISFDKIAREHGLSVDKMSYFGNQFKVVLSNSMVVELGSAKTEKRLLRILSLYKKISDYKNVLYFDMRYNKGFVVKYKD